MSVWHDAFAQKGPCGEMSFDPEFKEVSIMEQLAKIIDSESVREVVEPSRYKPVDSVTTDDGDVVKVSAAQARVLREAVFEIHAPHRLDAIKDLQTTKGLTEALKAIKV